MPYKAKNINLKFPGLSCNYSSHLVSSTLKLILQRPAITGKVLQAPAFCGPVCNNVVTYIYGVTTGAHMDLIFQFKNGIEYAKVPGTSYHGKVR